MTESLFAEADQMGIFELNAAPDKVDYASALKKVHEEISKVKESGLIGLPAKK